MRKKLYSLTLINFWQMKAILKNYRQSPRKVRLVADLMRGKKLDRALTEVRFLSKRASLPLEKLINSAAANAKQNFNIEREELFIKEIKVNKGNTLKRWMPRAFGRAAPVHKHSSNVSIVLDKQSLMKKRNLPALPTGRQDIKKKSGNKKMENEKTEKPSVRSKKTAKAAA